MHRSDNCALLVPSMLFYALPPTATGFVLPTLICAMGADSPSPPLPPPGARRTPPPGNGKWEAGKIGSTRASLPEPESAFCSTPLPLWLSVVASILYSRVGPTIIATSTSTGTGLTLKSEPRGKVVKTTTTDY
ncbi:hypothetical protein KQX54_006728 [Cotesia glomerata]|uniref:Secreted protein n=1 Tax=Cotesia glomerata TaxID=32391 RepID=A0AAV7IY43_COTGL|nr:hypothetical protein KQX54_006728 [Cotesia glomerata]